MGRWALTPVVATELEFYLLAGNRRERGLSSPPAALMYRDEPNGYQLYDMDAVDLLGDYLETLRAYARVQGLRPRRRPRQNSALGSSKSICRIVPDALAAADDCMSLKRIAEQAARQA